MVGVIWYRFVRYSGTDWSATLVPIRPLLWYRLERCAGTDSSATVVPIRRYYQVTVFVVVCVVTVGFWLNRRLSVCLCFREASMI